MVVMSAMKGEETQKVTLDDVEDTAKPKRKRAGLKKPDGAEAQSPSRAGPKEEDWERCEID